MRCEVNSVIVGLARLMRVASTKGTRVLLPGVAGKESTRFGVFFWLGNMFPLKKGRLPASKSTMRKQTNIPVDNFQCYL